MGEALAFSRELGVIKAGEVLAFPGSISEPAAKQISGSADELIRNVAGVMQTLVLSVIDKRTAAEFNATRETVFPKYFNAVLALSSLIQILVPTEVIDRLNQEFFSELEADLRESGLAVFGASVRDQAMFTVWTLRKISDYMAQINRVSATLDKEKLSGFVQIGNECMFHAIRTRFHIHCLVSSMKLDRRISPDALDLVIEGLRSAVNAYGLARKLLDIAVPLAEPVLDEVKWDDEDEALLREASFDVIPEPA